MRGSSLNERAVYLHIMEDVLGWVGVLVASIVMMFADIPVIDPILSIAISIWVLTNVYRNMKSTFAIMLQAVPDDVKVDELQAEINAIQGVASSHDLHLWASTAKTTSSRYTSLPTPPTPNASKPTS